MLQTMFSGEKLKKYREAKGLTKVALSASVGRTESYIRSLESGTKCEAFNTLKLLCDRLDITIEDLFVPIQMKGQ